MISRTNTAAAVALAAALILTGCNGGSADPQASTTTVPAPTTPEPAPTTESPADDEQTTTAPPELSAEEQDQADIEETLKLYNAALGRAVIGEESIEGIYPFSRDTAREQWVTQVMSYEAQGITFSGQSKLEKIEVTVDGDTAEATACMDVSDVEAVDKNGDSFISKDRLDRTLNDYVLERDDSAELGWYVVSDVNRNESCED